MKKNLSQLPLSPRSMHLHFARAQFTQARPYGAGRPALCSMLLHTYKNDQDTGMDSSEAMKSDGRYY